MSSTPKHLSEFLSLVDKQQNANATAIQTPTNAGTPNGRYSQASMRSDGPSSPYRGHSQNSSIASPTMSPIEDHPSFQHSGSGAQQHHLPSKLGYFRRPSVSSLGTVTSTIASTSYAAGVQMNHPDLPALITRREVTETLESYNGVLAAAARYREALLTVSSAAAEFGAALEDCARCKGAGSSAESLLAAGGLHYLVSNHQQILAKSIQRTFEGPVRRQVEQFKAEMASNDETFKQDMKVRTRQLKKQEMENARISRMRVRNLGAYRNSLLELTSQVDDIDRLKYEHFCQAFDLAQNTSTNILTYAASVVRAEVEIYEGIARKGWSGGGLDDLISTCPDPFAPAEEEDDEFDSGMGGTAKAASSSVAGKGIRHRGSFVETISGFLNPSQATATTASSSTNIKSFGVSKPSAQLSTSTLKAAGAEPQKHIKRSTGKGLFSILPSKSILPSYGQSNDASFDSDDEDRLDDKKTIEDKSNGKSKTHSDTAESIFTEPAPPATKHIYDTLATSLSSSGGFETNAKTAAPLSSSSPTKEHNASQSNESAHVSLGPSVITKSSSAPLPGSSLETTASDNSDGRRRPHHDKHNHPDADSDDMLSYNGWNQVQSTMSSSNE